jgi:hypothetical protein
MIWNLLLFGRSDVCIEELEYVERWLATSAEIMFDLGNSPEQAWR